MALKSRLRAAISRSNTNTSTPSSTASSSTSDLSSPTSPTSDTQEQPVLSPLTTVSTGLTLTTAPTATTIALPSSPLTKTPSRLRLLLTRTRSPKKSSDKALDREWFDYTGPRTRFRKAVDPVHRAQLEAWAMDFGRKGSWGGESAVDGKSPFASRAASLDVQRGEVEEL